MARSLEVEIPPAETLDEFLDILIPTVRHLGEDLREERFFLNKPWLQFKDDDLFHQKVLHFFNEGGEYLVSTDGNVEGGAWRILDTSNKMLLEIGGQAELYELAFLDTQFFILRKHGDQQRLGMPKYFVMTYEPIARHLEWRDAMELLFNRYRNGNRSYLILTVVIILLVVLALMLSLQ